MESPRILHNIWKVTFFALGGHKYLDMWTGPSVVLLILVCPSLHNWYWPCVSYVLTDWTNISHGLSKLGSVSHLIFDKYYFSDQMESFSELYMEPLYIQDSGYEIYGMCQCVGPPEMEWTTTITFDLVPVISLQIKRVRYMIPGILPMPWWAKRALHHLLSWHHSCFLYHFSTARFI